MSVYDRIPKGANEADAMLGTRNFLALDRVTRLVREPDGTVAMLYRWRCLVRWHPAGHMRVSSYATSRVALRRIAAALPEEWTVEFRTRHRRPSLVYRGSYAVNTGAEDVVFRADGGLQWCYGASQNSDVTTRDELDRDVSVTEGFTPLRTRRRGARVRPNPVAFAEMPAVRRPPRRRRTSQRGDVARATFDLWQSVGRVRDEGVLTGVDMSIVCSNCFATGHYGIDCPGATPRRPRRPTFVNDAATYAPPASSEVCGNCDATYGQHFGEDCYGDNDPRPDSGWLGSGEYRAETASEYVFLPLDIPVVEHAPARPSLYDTVMELTRRSPSRPPLLAFDDIDPEPDLDALCAHCDAEWGDHDGSRCPFGGTHWLAF